MTWESADSTLASSAWFNGSFYLGAAVVFLSVLTFIAGNLDVFRLALVVAGSFAGLTLIGALQLMNDGKISERGFLEAIHLSLTRVLLPVLKKAKP